MEGKRGRRGREEKKEGEETGKDRGKTIKA